MHAHSFMPQVSGKPIKFVGVGEKLEALEPFYPERMASRILGMGDVLTLFEKAETAMKVRVKYGCGILDRCCLFLLSAAQQAGHACHNRWT
jgi:hypothetical protein